MPLQDFEGLSAGAVPGFTNIPTAVFVCDGAGRFGEALAANDDKAIWVAGGVRTDSYFKISRKGGATDISAILRSSVDGLNGYLLIPAFQSGSLTLYACVAGAYVGPVTIAQACGATSADDAYVEGRIVGTHLYARMVKVGASVPTYVDFDLTNAAFSGNLFTSGYTGLRVSNGGSPAPMYIQSIEVRPAGNPGVNGRTLSDFNTTPFKNLLRDQGIVPNFKPGIPGSYLDHDFIIPAAYYGGNQPFLHDSVYNSLCASYFGYHQQAKDCYLNWINVQPTTGPNTGKLPISVTPTDFDTDSSNPPVLSYGAIEVYEADKAANAGVGDKTWLAAVYPVCKAFHTWFTSAKRTDPSGVTAWGSSSTNDVYSTPGAGDYSVNYPDQCSREGGGDDIGYIYQPGDYTRRMVGYERLSHACPDASAQIVQDCESLAEMATELAIQFPGSASAYNADAAAFTAERTTRLNRTNALLWDCIGGRYGMLEDSTRAKSVGTVTAGGAAGAASVTLTIGGASVCLPRGAKLIFSGGATGQVAATVRAANGATGTVVTLVTDSLTGTVTSSETVTMRRFAPYTNSPFQIMPLWAGVADTARATRILGENLRFVFDGSQPDTAEFEFSSLLAQDTGSTWEMDFYNLRQRETAWLPVFVNWINKPYPGNSGTDAFVPGGYQMNGTAENTGAISLLYRWKDIGDPMIYHDQSQETVSAAYPLTVSVTYTVTANTNAIVTLYDLTDNPIAGGSFPLTGAEAAGTRVTRTATFAPATPIIVGTIQVGRTAGAATLVVESVVATTHPRGYIYETPFGILSQSNRSRYSFDTPYDFSNVLYSSTQNHSLEIANKNYWKGDDWPQNNWHTVKGLLRAGLVAAATEIATKFVAAWYNEVTEYNQVRERMSQSGMMSGADQYGWGAIPALTMDAILNPDGEDPDPEPGALTAGTLTGPSSVAARSLKGFTATAPTDGVPPYTYRKEYKRSDSAIWLDKGPTVLTPFNVSVPSPSTQYNVRQRQEDSEGTVVYTNTQTATTDEAEPIGSGGGDMGFPNIVSGVKDCVLDRNVEAPASTCGLRLLASGDVTYVDREGSIFTFTADAPMDLNTQVKRVLSEGTDIDEGDIKIAYAVSTR